jgi:predicted PurR-regulated permease PerM
MAPAGALTAPDDMNGATSVIQWRFWLALAAAFVLALWLLNDILLPFVVGAVVAYFFDPVVGRLQKLGMSRDWATVAVTVLAILLAVGIVLAVVPPLVGQTEKLLTRVPQYVARIVARVQPLVEPLREQFDLPGLSIQELQADATKWVGQALATAGVVLGALLRQGVAIVNVLGLLFITPVVTFYLLRDWEKIVASLDACLPREHADTIRTLVRDSNAAIAGYVRGQGLVCLCLGAFYAIGLSLVGLEFGVVIGLIAGLISFIPFVGTFAGGAVATAMAIAQFAPDWLAVAKVFAVFVVGQVIEGNFLSPKLVGDRVGLHPVWIMFALLAGGALFGFVGVLVAVPVAAVIGVLVRHLMGRYRASAIYRGPQQVPP